MKSKIYKYIEWDYGVDLYKVERALYNFFSGLPDETWFNVLVFVLGFLLISLPCAAILTLMTLGHPWLMLLYFLVTLLGTLLFFRNDLECIWRKLNG